MNNNNFDENTMDNIKNMVDNGDISGAISQISPEMIQNFSKLFSENSTNNQTINNSNNFNNSNNTVQNNSSSNNSTQENRTNDNFDFSNIDMNTIMKMSSALGSMKNNKNDPRTNLLNSLKPYLRDSKKNQLDNYVNLLNMSKIAEIMKKNNNKEN